MFTCIVGMKPAFIDEIVTEHQPGQMCDINGRVSAVRRHGNLVFLDITDHTGKLQVVVEKNGNDAIHERTTDITVGSYISATGEYRRNRRGDPEINATDLDVLAHAMPNVSPSPWEIDGLDPKHGKQVFDFPSIYVANPQRAAVLRIKTNFVTALHEYLHSQRFTLVEPPIITNKTLYSVDNAVHAKIHGEDVFLSQCATFELEPLALAFGKVYTISPAFRNENSGSKRHLGEYTHAKAEVMLADIDDLMLLAGESLYHSLKATVEKSERELTLLGKEIDFERIHPSRHVHMTYDEALKVTRARGSDTEYGSGLTRADELILTKYVGDQYLWMQFPPFASEGFPYRRKTDQPHLSMTCDLIAPHGAGEMVGVAEKTTSAEELVRNLVEKGKGDQLGQYWDYIVMRRYGLPPHGGMGAAPERIIYGLLGLDHIRLTKPWPVYPDRRVAPAYADDGSLPTWGDPELERIVTNYNPRPRR